MSKLNQFLEEQCGFDKEFISLLAPEVKVDILEGALDKANAHTLVHYCVTYTNDFTWNSATQEYWINQLSANPNARNVLIKYLLSIFNPTTKAEHVKETIRCLN